MVAKVRQHINTAIEIYNKTLLNPETSVVERQRLNDQVRILEHIDHFLARSENGKLTDFIKDALRFIETIPVSDDGLVIPQTISFRDQLKRDKQITLRGENENIINGHFAEVSNGFRHFLGCIHLTLRLKTPLNLIAWTYEYPKLGDQVVNPAIIAWQKTLKTPGSKDRGCKDYTRDIKIEDAVSADQEEAIKRIDALVAKSKYTQDEKNKLSIWLRDTGQDIFHVVEYLINHGHIRNVPGFGDRLLNPDQYESGYNNDSYTPIYLEKNQNTWSVTAGEIDFICKGNVRGLRFYNEKKQERLIYITPASSGKCAMQVLDELAYDSKNDMPPILDFSFQLRLTINAKGEVEPQVRKFTVASYMDGAGHTELKSPDRIRQLRESLTRQLSLEGLFGMRPAAADKPKRPASLNIPTARSDLTSSAPAALMKKS